MNDERQAFEAWAVKTICHQSDLQRGELTGYRSQELNYLWRGWQAARAASPAPAGWKLVPVEPTEAMRSAGIEANGAHLEKYSEDGIFRTTRIYRAMLAASPASTAQPPQGAQQEPLTEERLREFWDEATNRWVTVADERNPMLRFARAIERAHGIGQEGETR
jgi:hypothetical protein